MPFPPKYIQTEMPMPYLSPDNYMLKLDQMNIFRYRVLIHRDNNYQYYSEYGKLIEEKYNSMKDLVTKEIAMVSELEKEGMRKNLPDLNYSTLEKFILEKGEQYLYSKFAICGKDLSAYMVWAAFHNQFANCKLTEVSSSKVKEEIEVDNIPEFLFSVFIVSGRVDPSTCILRDIELYDNIFGFLKSDFIIYTKDKNERYDVISDSALKRYIIAFIQKFFKGNVRMSNKYLQMIEHEEDKTFELTDDMFTREDYLLCSMANSILYDEDKDEPTDNVRDNNLIDTYKNLYKIRELFREKLILPLDGEIGYIYPTINGYDNNPLNNDDTNLIISTFELINKDINYKVFNKNGTGLSLTTIYNVLKNTFFFTEDHRPSGGSRTLIVKEIIDIPQNRSGINLLYKYPYNREENYENKADYLSVTVDEYVEGYYDEEEYGDEYDDKGFEKQIQSLLNTISISNNDETIDDNQHSNNIENIPTNQEPTENELKDTEEHTPDEPDNSEWQKVNDNEITDKQEKDNDSEEDNNNPEENS